MAPKPPGHHIKNNPVLSKAQVKAIVTRRIMGSSVAQIADEFQMSTDTVERKIKWATRNGLIESALDHVLDKIVPEALKTYLLAIQGGDVDAARDVMFGTGILQKAPKTGIAPTAIVEMTIEQYRQERQSIASSLMAADAPKSGLISEGPAPGERLPFDFDPAILEAEVDGDDSDAGVSPAEESPDEPEAES